MAGANLSTSILGLASQPLESSLTTILMEAVLKLSSLTDADVFVMVNSATEGRCWAGRKQLRDFFVSGRLHPEPGDTEFDVDPRVSSLIKKSTAKPAAPANAPSQDVHRMQIQLHKKMHHQISQMLAAQAGVTNPLGGGAISPPAPIVLPETHRGRGERDASSRHHSSNHAVAPSTDPSIQTSRKRANSDRDSSRSVQQLPQLSNSLSLPPAVASNISPHPGLKPSNHLLSPVTNITVPSSSKQPSILRSASSNDYVELEDISPPLNVKPEQQPLPLQQFANNAASTPSEILNATTINSHHASSRFLPAHYSCRTESIISGTTESNPLLKEEVQEIRETKDGDIDDRDLKHAVSFFDRAQRAFQQELANVAAAASSGNPVDNHVGVSEVFVRPDHAAASSHDNRARADSGASTDVGAARFASPHEAIAGADGANMANHAGHGDPTTTRYSDAVSRFPPLGIDIPPPSGHHEPGSPAGSDNGMGDYEDDIPAGGSAFGSGGNGATAVGQRGGEFGISSGDPPPGGSRDTGRPPGGGGGGAVGGGAVGGGLEGGDNLTADALAGLKGLDPNSETIVRYPSQRGKTKLCYKGWRYVFDRPVSKPYPLHLFLCMYKRDKKCKGAVWIDPVSETVHKTVEHDYDTTPQFEAARREVEDRLQFSLYYSNMQTHNPTNPMAGTPGINFPPI